MRSAAPGTPDPTDEQRQARGPRHRPRRGIRFVSGAKVDPRLPCDRDGVSATTRLPARALLSGVGDDPRRRYRRSIRCACGCRAGRAEPSRPPPQQRRPLRRRSRPRPSPWRRAGTDRSPGRASRARRPVDGGLELPSSRGRPPPGSAGFRGRGGLASWTASITCHAVRSSRAPGSVGSLRAAIAPAAPTAAIVGSMPPSSDVSYSATVAKTGRPAEAASARVAASPATIDSRLPFSVASRAEQPEIDARRRDARAVRQHDRDPDPSARTDRAAAGVISSSMSR